MEETKVRNVKLGAILLIVMVLGVLILQTDAVPIVSSTLSSTFANGNVLVADAPTGYDPLTAQEVGAVIAAAQQAASDAAQTMSAAQQQTVGRQELLLVERREADKAAYAKGSWARQGDVYLYDYATDTLIHTVVDIQSGAVLTVEQMQGVQLPLTQREEEHALALLQADQGLWTTLARRYQTVTGEALERVDQLQVKVSVFHADVMPDRLNTAAQMCGQHRCAQILLFTVDKTLLDMTPIVDLSQEKIVQVLNAE
jgi:Cu2+-containing amine oxidase